MNKGILLGVGALIGYFLLRSGKTTEAAETDGTGDGSGGGSTVDEDEGDEYGLLIPGAGGGGGGGDSGDDGTGDDGTGDDGTGDDGTGDDGTGDDGTSDGDDGDGTGDTGDDGGGDGGEGGEGGDGSEGTDESPYPPLTPTDPVEFFQVGDVNLDGVVNIVDAMLIEQYRAALRTFSPLQMKLADVDQDGKVTMSDVLAISRYTVGLATIPDVWFNQNGDEMQETETGDAAEVNLITGWTVVTFAGNPVNPDPDAVFPGNETIYYWDPVKKGYFTPASIVSGVAYSVAYVSPTVLSVPIQSGQSTGVSYWVDEANFPGHHFDPVTQSWK